MAINQQNIHPVSTNSKEFDAINHFMGLKRMYEEQRKPWERCWEQAMCAVRVQDDIDRVYKGASKIKSPIMAWKVDGVVSRVMRILFNVKPIARIEDTKIIRNKSLNSSSIVDLWQTYMMEYQLNKINFQNAFDTFQRNKFTQGTAIAKITQEYETKKFDYFGDGDAEEEIVVKDDTYFRNLLITEFYSDVNKEDINDSQACIHSTVLSMSELENKMYFTEELNSDGQLIQKKEKAYKNLDLIRANGNNITEEQERYIQSLRFNSGQSKTLKQLRSSFRDSNKTGFVRVDECYGLYDINGNGEEVEVKCTIANGSVLLDLIPTPHKHKRYIRPFIKGVARKISNCLYGDSFVTLALPALMELNAARAQVIDAKSRSILPMYYMDKSRDINWDGTWRPNGIIKGVGPSGVVPLINPNLSNIPIKDAEMAARDIDQLTNLSPVQEGTSDRRHIPSTASATRQLISQNDMPLNAIIMRTIEDEIKPFLEMLFERNLVNKSISDLLVIFDDKKLRKLGFEYSEDENDYLIINGDRKLFMDDLLIDINIKILGNLELSNEVAQQTGWQQFLNFASTNPVIAERLDWKSVGNKMLKSFGIKDDSEEIWLDEEVVLEVKKKQQQAQIEQQQFLQSQEELERQKSKNDYLSKVEVDTESKLVEMNAEAAIEKSTGQKVQ
tara:strand:+ start:2052 stop:4064 length:2013 start_codon:yes stop_codon:yes gene_type:complete